ncbi:hypothetical protein ACOSP7_016157 [Xanthoceras sorbifolium]
MNYEEIAILCESLCITDEEEPSILLAENLQIEAIDQNFKFGVWLRASSPRRSVSRGSTSASADGSDSRNEAGVGKERVHTSVLFGTPSKEATAPSPSLFVDTPNPFPTSKLSDFEGRRCTPIVCPVSSERRFDHQHSSGQDGIASGAVKTSIMRMGKELPLATHKYIIDDSLGSKRVEIVSPLDASGDLVDVALHGTVPSSEFLHDSYAHVVSGPVVHEDVFYFNEGASSSTPTPLHGSVDYIGTTKPVSTRKRSRWKRLAHEGMLLDPVFQSGFALRGPTVTHKVLSALGRPGLPRHNALTDLLRLPQIRI